MVFGIRDRKRISVSCVEVFLIKGARAIATAADSFIRT